MFKIKTATRLAISVGFILTSLLWLAMSLGILPDPEQKQLEHRTSLTKSIAVSVSMFVETSRFPELANVLARNVELQRDIVSIGLRRERGEKRLLAAGDHETHWLPMNEAQNHARQVAINILSNGQKWGQLEIVFQPKPKASFAWLFAFPNNLILFLTSGLTLITWYMLNRTFRYLNPSKVVPNRVRSALDSIGSGLVLVTPDGEIAHANRAFGKIIKLDQEHVVGTNIDSFPWSCSEDGPQELPWIRCKKIKAAISGDVVEARISTGSVQKFMVNATPIYGSKNQSRGMLISFEDVTALESKKAELARIIQTVRMSRDEVERQNEQLTFLASYDPLTKCMNRRSFFPQFEKLWGTEQLHPLAILMFDIDHFKAVNDDHGHSTGDEVLKSVGEILNAVIGKKGIVCRYGGEEFSMLIPDLPVDECFGLAEAIRTRIESEPIAGLKITASLGLSVKAWGAMDPQHMLDQADQCLYVAKRNGRNQVVRFDQCPTVEEEAESAAIRDAARDSNLNANATESATAQPPSINCQPDSSREIEGASVTGLLSALSLRSPKTAEHSVRVANLAVAIGESIFDKRELFNLEVAALLHDVGKIGIPDSILNKPEKLTPEEWEVMRHHDEIGLKIVRDSFASEVVAETIAMHHQKVRSVQIGSQTDLAESVSSKILYVCDAFDSMVTGQPYRDGLSTAQALIGILKNTPSQFDPVSVNGLVTHIAAKGYPQQSGTHEPRETEFEQLIELAESVMALCDSTRSTFLADSRPTAPPVVEH